MSNLLAFVDLMTRLHQVNVIVGIVLAAVGIALALLARRITRAIKKGQEVTDDNKLFITFKAIGLILVIAGLVCTVVQ